MLRVNVTLPVKVSQRNYLRILSENSLKGLELRKKSNQVSDYIFFLCYSLQ